jgi:hypothetical protein
MDGHVGIGTSVDAFFRQVSGHESFDSLVSARRERGKSAHLLDLAGSGNTIAALEGDASVTAVRLEPTPGPMRVRAPEGRRHEINGNLFKRKTWNAIKKSVRTRSIRSFDIIVARPGGPLVVSEPHHPEAYTPDAALASYLVLARRAYSMLSRDDGVMLVQIPRHVERSGLLEPWVENLRKAEIHVEYSSQNPGFDAGAMMLTKSKGSAAVLPGLAAPDPS